MIDTVILNISKKQVQVLDTQNNPWDLQARTDNYDKFVKNPTPTNIRSGLYFPRLTGYNRKNGKMLWEQMMKIEFSAPKLLYKNNLDELTENQFGDVVLALQDRLRQMGVIVTEEVLKTAVVATVHYSKNVELKGGYTSQYVLSELGKINLNKRFDFAKARFINDGQSLCAHTATHELIIYDKIADLIKSDKRTIDRDLPDYQMSLFRTLEKNSEVLRFEDRLCKKTKINSLFKELGFGINPTFKDVFSEEKSRKVLLWYWNKMFEGDNLFLFAHPLTAKDLLNQILLARLDIKGKNAIYLTGLVLVASEGNGLRELRAILTKRSNDRTWYRIVDDLSDITGKLAGLQPREWFNQIKKEIENYTPLKLSTLGVCKQ